MSLVGNLEDLGLGDILQIVSLSRNSGVLSLRSQGLEGRISFRNGEVFQAASSAFKENLGDLLLKRGLVDVESLRKALLCQLQSCPSQSILDVLAMRFGADRNVLEGIVREQVEKIVYSFFGWSKGTFSFDLGGQDEPGNTPNAPPSFRLEVGLNPQRLAVEGSRILDESRRRGMAVEEDATFPHHGGEARQSSGEPAVLIRQEVQSQELLANRVLLVDDDNLARNILADTLRSCGLAVKEFEFGQDFLAAAETEFCQGLQPALVIDLIMPRLDGSGLLGGFELLERARRKFPALRTVAVSDFFDEETERRISGLGVSLILQKPKKMDLLEDHGRQALVALGEEIAWQLGRDGGTAVPRLYDIGAELLRELGESDAAARGKGPESPGLRLLRGMLQELSNLPTRGEINLLVLRFASELMNRAVIFTVREDEIAGLGQFGVEDAGEMADVRVRRMKIPLDEESVFLAAVREGAPLKLRPGTGKWDSYLVRHLGNSVPEQIFLGPIISEGQAVAILYGDNLPENKPIGDTEVLEIFLSQVGLAMDRATLERRLRGNDAV